MGLNEFRNSACGRPVGKLFHKNCPAISKAVLQIVCAGEWKTKPVNGVFWRILAVTIYKLMLKILGHKAIQRFVYHSSHVGFTSASKRTPF